MELNIAISVVRVTLKESNNTTYLQDNFQTNMNLIWICASMNKVYSRNESVSNSELSDNSKMPFIFADLYTQKKNCNQFKQNVCQIYY